MKREIPHTNEIRMFMHCGLCLKEKPPNQSPCEFARLSVGATTLGFQVWCERHQCNVMHVDFEGQKHPACLTRHETEEETALRLATADGKISS